MGWVATLFEKHKFIRRTGMLLCYAMNAATLTLAGLAVIYQYVISDNARLILIAILGLNSLYIGLYQWDRMQDKYPQGDA